MSLDYHVSRRRRGLSPKINPIAKIGRRNVVLSTQKSVLRTTLYDSSSSSFYPSPIIHKMASSGGFGGTGSSLSSQYSSSSIVANFFDLPPKILSTWENLIYWFRSTYGKSKSPAEKLQD
jgi:hypothetical protein